VRGARNHGLLNIAVPDLFNTRHWVPSNRTEQEKIAALFNLIEERIQTQKKLIEKYESLIRGLISSVNKGEICKCKATALRDVLTEVHEKNVENYEVCSVSVSQGVINQIDYLGRSFAAKEVLHYNVVHYGDLVYTKSPTGEFPFGIVKRSNLDRPVAVSPLYGVYRPVNDTIGIYLHLYFKSPVYTKNYLHSLIQKGAKNTINITNQHFLNNKIQIPEPDFLEIFVHAASEIEKKIQAENRVLASFEKQKNYLLSKMFI
jgi:type I restriction enzyme S subunit